MVVAKLKAFSSPAVDGRVFLLGERTFVKRTPKDSAVKFLTNECVFPEPIDDQKAEEVWAQYRDGCRSFVMLLPDLRVMCLRC